MSNPLLKGAEDLTLQLKPSFLTKDNEKFHLIFDDRTQSYNTPFRFDIESSKFIKQEVENSRVPWSLLNQEPSYTRMNTVQRAVGRVMTYARTGSEMTGGEAVTGFYVAPNIIMTVQHILKRKNDFPFVLFCNRIRAAWSPSDFNFGENTWALTLLEENEGLDVSLWRIDRMSDIFLSVSDRVLNIPENRTEILEQTPAVVIQENLEQSKHSAVFAIGYNGDVTYEQVLSWNKQLAPSIRNKIGPTGLPLVVYYQQWLQPDYKTASPGNIIAARDGVFAVTCSFVNGYCGGPLLFVDEVGMSFVGYVVMGSPPNNFNVCFSAQRDKFRAWFSAALHKHK
jgi:hypothetical protein